MSMTPEEAIRMLEAKSKCMKREVSGTDFDCNSRNCYKCDLNYEQGTIGDQIEALSVAISALQAQDLQQTCNQLATDTISRQEAIDELKRISFSHWFEYGEYLSEDTREIEIINSDKALEVIEALPSEQPEIVRCKDCKYWREHKYAKETKRYIPFCGFNAIYTKADDFCSRAERRTDG